MKKYVFKSVIVFTMILILGLILIPMIPTAEKEYIYRNGYELLVDSEEMSFTNNYYSYNINENEYEVFLISFYNVYLGGEVFVNLTYNSNTFFSFGGTEIPIQYIDDKIILQIDNYLIFGRFDISVWGVSK